MQKDDIIYNFFQMNWSFFSFENYKVLIDEENNYISFVNNKLFEKIISLVNSKEFEKTKTLKEIVQSINKTPY